MANLKKVAKKIQNREEFDQNDMHNIHKSHVERSVKLEKVKQAKKEAAKPTAKKTVKKGK